MAFGLSIFCRVDALMVYALYKTLPNVERKVKLFPILNC